MCQEGAMQMAVEGKTWHEIISFYFQGVSIIDYTKVRDFLF
jgi:peptidoglycan hydrolase-like amidase